MGGPGAFFTGLLGGFSDATLKAEQDEYQKEVERLRLRRQGVAGLLSDPQMEWKVKLAIVKRLSESEAQPTGPRGWRGKTKKAGAPIDEVYKMLEAMPEFSQAGRPAVTQEALFPQAVTPTGAQGPEIRPEYPGGPTSRAPEMVPGPALGALPPMPTTRAQLPGIPAVQGIRRDPREVAREQAEAQAQAQVAALRITGPAFEKEGYLPPGVSTIPQAALQQVTIDDPDNPGEPLTLAFNPATGIITNMVTGQVISRPRGYKAPATLSDFVAGFLKRTGKMPTDKDIAAFHRSYRAEPADVAQGRLNRLIEEAATQYLSETGNDPDKALAKVNQEASEPGASAELKRNAAQIRQRIRERVRPGKPKNQQDRLAEILGED